MDWNAIYETYQLWILRGCVTLLAVLSLWLFLCAVLPCVWEVIRRHASLGAIEGTLVAVIVCGFAFHGSTKHIYYDGGITAESPTCVVTNNTISIFWKRDTSSGVYVPESARVYIDYRPCAATNEAWVSLAQTTVGAWKWSGTVENATNYDYLVWTYYIPPEPVHTNGVWVYKTMLDRRAEKPLPLRARVEINGKAIATPKEARKDEEQDD